MIDLEKLAEKFIDIVFRLIGRIPRSRSFVVSSLLGRLFYLVDKKHRTIVLDSMARSFGDQMSPHKRKLLAKRVFMNAVQTVLEVGWSLSRDNQQLTPYFRIKGRSNIEEAHAKGRGVLVLTAHFGNWELLSVVGSMLDHPISVVYRPLDFKPLDRFFVRMRTRFGSKVIPNRRALRQVMSALRDGNLVGLLMDQNVDWYEGVFVDFMGRRACTNKGLALLAMKTGAPVIPLFMVREKEGFVAEFLTEIPFERTGDRTRDIDENTARYNEVIESFLRRHPDQWLWLHQRWKTRPYQPWPRQAA